MSGISKSSVCKDIDERVNAFLRRPLAGEWPYLGLDATHLKAREGGRIVSVAAIIAVAVTTEEKREIVGLHIGPSEAEPFWSTFLRDLVRRGLKGVKLVINDAHEGLKAAITRVVGATRQRCRVLIGWLGSRQRRWLYANLAGQGCFWLGRQPLSAIPIHPDSLPLRTNHEQP